jgi:uncharacterized protein YqgV (UPF0045/DUF77 family)
MNHPFIVSAAIQLVPVVAGERHPYEWIDEVIDLIKASNVNYEVGPFSTTLESDYKSIMKIIDDINSYLLSKKCPEWLLNIQIQVRSEADITAAEKVDKHLH